MTETQDPHRKWLRENAAKLDSDPALVANLSGEPQDYPTLRAIAEGDWTKSAITQVMKVRSESVVLQREAKALLAWCDSLKAEVVRLTAVARCLEGGRDSLKAENERLTEALASANRTHRAQEEREAFQRDRAEKAEAEAADLRARLDKAEKALRDLTPGGSEFQTPEECSAYVRESRTLQHETVVRFKLRADEAERELAEARRRLAELQHELDMK